MCLHNATTGTEDAKLVQMWSHVTPEQAHALLSKPDVTVTNQGDKEMQLDKIATLDGEVRAALGVDPAGHCAPRARRRVTSASPVLPPP